jgi:hypothetical protein
VPLRYEYFHRAVLGCCKRKKPFLAASASHAESVISFNFRYSIAVHLFCSQEKMSERNETKIRTIFIISSSPNRSLHCRTTPPISPCHATPLSQLPPSSVFCFLLLCKPLSRSTLKEDARRHSLCIYRAASESCRRLIRRPTVTALVVDTEGKRFCWSLCWSVFCFACLPALQTAFDGTDDARGFQSTLYRAA